MILVSDTSAYLSVKFAPWSEGGGLSSAKKKRNKEHGATRSVARNCRLEWSRLLRPVCVCQRERSPCPLAVSRSPSGPCGAQRCCCCRVARLDLCASYIFILYLPASPPFSSRIYYLCIPFFSLCLYPRIRANYLEGYQLLLLSFLRTFALHLTPLPAATTIGAIDF